jgi:SH3-like domain-containing protein
MSRGLITWTLLIFSTVGAAAWAAEPVCSKTAVTLRKAPNAREAVSWKVGKNMPFLRLETKKGWAKLQDLEGEIHYARAVDFSSKTRCVVVKTNVAALHKDPVVSSAATDLKTLDRYTPLKRVNDNREWIQVEDEAGRLAWIHETQVWKPVKVNAFSF